MADTTNWDTKLNDLKDRVKLVNDDIDTIDYEEIHQNLDKIQSFIQDSKKTHGLTVEEVEELQNKIKLSYEDLEKMIVLLETKVKALKQKHETLKARVATIGGLCVGGGILAGVSLTLGWKSLKAFIVKYTTGSAG